MQEIWKDIKGYENMYQISNKGNVKSLGNNKTKKEKILKPLVDKEGYLSVVLWKNGVQKKYSVHRLVAQAFIPNPNNLAQVNHKDENKQNNCVENLEYCDAKYNNNYGTRNKRIAEKHINGKKSKVVLQYDLNGNFVKEWSSINEVQRQLGLTHISECCKGNRKTCGGYKWQYN